jgi:hypothetical protein
MELVRERRKEHDLRHQQHLVRDPDHTSHDRLPPICAVGTGASSGLQACDYVAVVASGIFTVSGQLTASSPLIERLAKDSPSLANVANAKVEAIDSEGESTVTTTAADGSYSLGVPRGTYTIKVYPDNGADARGATTPGTRTVIVSENAEHVDFALGRVMHLQGELIAHGSAVHHKLRLSVSFLDAANPSAAPATSSARPPCAQAASTSAGPSKTHGST